MTYQLPADCLNEIIEHLEQDKTSLGSCLLANRLLCKIAVRLLWRNVWNTKYTSRQKYVPLSILSTLTACLSNESKTLLRESGILIPTPTSKSPLFNYVSFIKILSLNRIESIVGDVLNPNKIHLVLQELLKAFMNQTSSIKSLDYNTVRNIPFVSFPGAKDCLTDLLVFKCIFSRAYSEHIDQLSLICHNIQTLSITLFDDDASDGLRRLISSQKNLKSLGLAICKDNLEDVIPIIRNHHNTLTRLHLFTNRSVKDFTSFVAPFMTKYCFSKLTNL